ATRLDLRAGARQGDGERRAQSLAGALRPQPPAVLLDDRAADVQAKAHPGDVARPRVRGAPERLEDGLERGRRHADALVAHANDRRIAGALESHPDRAPIRAVLDRVVEKVDEDLF